MANIVVLGAGGMLGSDLIGELKSRNLDAIGFNRLQCDVTNRTQCADVIARANPAVVINCAAYTDVNRAESEREAAFGVNALGAENVARACAAAKARCFYVSTDYVFDGTKAGPYVEDDATNPLNAYGESKLEGERRTAAACESHCIVRSSWLYGRHGRNFVGIMLERARSGGPLRVVNDQVGSPTSTIALARTLAALASSNAAGIVHATCSGACSWYDFAREIFDIAGIKPSSLEPVGTSEFVTPARRPANSQLACTRLQQFVPQAMPHWRDALREYISSLELERC